jgi:tRNA nucleotidyltransferase (CCA-adding enzyme)
VLLVDTGVLTSVRGIRADKVKVQVIDHHDVAGGRERGWTYHIEPVGATTTILVEMLREAGLTVSTTAATLLLLGIHEDTGSLVYDTTTPRDAQAAAWLLEQGAQLAPVRRFLNIPLSEAQRALYDQLSRALEWQTIEGQSVARAAVVAPPGFEDEISAVAHRLREALLPDCMILLVQLKPNHVQLVARSSADSVDVSILARAFGGGGHSRAAAATIMDRDLEEVHQHVLEVLPTAFRPVTTVAQIMSYGVQTLPDDTTVGAAAELMRRFGHEGFPVVGAASHQLVGLLSRRMVDRAVSHQLEQLPVSQIMKTGQVMVRPSDPVDHVQRLMIQEGWGQIPVAAEGEPDDGAGLIGIVTRTDLINLVSRPDSRTEREDMHELMARSLPAALWEMVRAVGKVASELDTPLYFVGGVVRDLLLGKPPTDIDMVVEGEAVKLVRRLRRIYGGETRSHAQFGTAKWIVAPAVWQNIAPAAATEALPRAIDFVTARTEFYNRPSALPEVERGSIKLDLHRRDFTINTLAIRLDGAFLGQLLDFYGGRRDLEQGLIRVLHSLSFVDDPTRILRGIRLEQRLSFELEPRTEELLTAALPMLNRLGGDRIRNEIELCLLEERRVDILQRLDELDVLAALHPELRWHGQTAGSFARVQELMVDEALARALDGNPPVFPYFALWMLAQPSPARPAIMTRLKVRAKTSGDVMALGRLLADLAELGAEAKPSRVYGRLKLYPPRVLLTAMAAVPKGSPSARQLERYYLAWRTMRPALDGNDLQALGLPRGPEIGRLLVRLLEGRLDGTITTEAQERALAAEALERIRVAAGEGH